MIVVLSSVFSFVLFMMGLWVYRSVKKKKTVVADSFASIAPASKMKAKKVYPDAQGGKVQVLSDINEKEISPDVRGGSDTIEEAPSKMTIKKVYADVQHETLKSQAYR